MTPRSLDWALRTRGTLIAGWPAAERDAALALLRRSQAARAILADALTQDDTEAAVSDGCALVRMQDALRGAFLQLPPLTFALRWSVLAACAAAGLYVGIAGAAGDAWAELGTDQSDAFSTVQSMTVASSF